MSGFLGCVLPSANVSYGVPGSFYIVLWVAPSADGLNNLHGGGLADLRTRARHASF